MQRSHSTRAQLTASHCRLTSPTGEWLFTDAWWRLIWLAAKITCDRFSRYSKRLDTFRTALLASPFSHRKQIGIVTSYDTVNDWCVKQEYSSLVCGSFYHCGNCKYRWELSKSPLPFLIYISLVSLYQQMSIFKKSGGVKKENSHVSHGFKWRQHIIHVPPRTPKYVRDVQTQKIYKITYFHFFFFKSRSIFGFKPSSGKYHNNLRQIQFQTRSTDTHSTTHMTAPPAHTRSNSIQRMPTHNSHYSHHYNLDSHHIYTPTTSDGLTTYMASVT